MSAQLDALRAFVAARPAAPPAPAGPSVLVVGSGKGGTGASVVAALVALAAAAGGRRVLLVDADPHVGPLRYLLGTPAAPSLADLRAGLDVEAVRTPVSATLSLVAGGPPTVATPAPAAVDPAEHRSLLRRVAALYPGHDLIVVDGGSRLDTVCACCEAGGVVPTRLLVVTDTEPIALAASYALVKAAAERTAALPGGPVAAEVIVNRQDEEAARHGFAQIEAATHAFLGAAPAKAGVRLAGALPEDTSLAVALRAGMPLQDAATGSPAAVAAQALTDRLLSELQRPARPASRAAQVYGARPPALPTAARAAALPGAYR